MRVDVVYPVRPGDHSQPDFLRYSLRSIWHHLPIAPDSRVWFIGHQPSFINWEHFQVGHIPSKQRTQAFANIVEPQLRFENQRANLEALLAHEEVAENLLWMNDDFYLLKDLPDLNIPYYHRGPLGYYVHNLPEGGSYRQGLEFCLKVLDKWGIENPLAYNVHMPVRYRKSRLGEVLERAWGDGVPGGFARVLYPPGETDFPHVRVADPKIKGIDGRADLKDTWISTNDTSWKLGAVGKLIRARYWRPSIFEVSS